MDKIIIKNLNVIYDNSTLRNRKNFIVAIDDLNATFEENKFNVIIGPSGCGKSTLLKAIIGLIPYNGQILLDNIDASLFKINEKNLSFVSQNFALYPRMTVFDNIAFPLKLKDSKRDEIISIVKEVSERLGISNLLDRKPKELSIGQQQKVALARMIVKQPTLYLFDEPLSNIDLSKRGEVRALIKNITNLYGGTILYVTHDINEAISLADKIYVMDEGKIVFVGTPNQFGLSDNEIVIRLRNAGLRNEIL